jgi:hypothetical protein
MVQNVNKIHGMARLISAKRDHQQLVAAQGWSKTSEYVSSRLTLMAIRAKKLPCEDWLCFLVGQNRNAFKLPCIFD